MRTIEKQIKWVEIARGLIKAEKVLKNCQIVNVFNGKIEEGDIAIQEGLIVGVGSYEGDIEIDCGGKYVCPGLIDGHVHIESSLLTPTGFAKAVIPNGTTTVIADPHEIANVCGLSGIDFMMESAKRSPLDVYIMLPSCVPSTEFENAGANLEAKDLESLMHEESVLGLGEMMNYPGVFYGNKGVHEKLILFKEHRIDGHAPGVKGKDLNSYVLSGISTDHECVSKEELEEKVARGMYIQLREGSATRNVDELSKGVSIYNSRRLMFCTDDKHPTDISSEGHIDYNIKRAIANNVDPIIAITMGSLNVAECYGLQRKGAVAPGYEADLILLDDIKSFDVLEVYKKGELVGKNKKALFEPERYEDSKVLATIHLKDEKDIDLSLYLKSEYVKVISLLNHSIITKKVVRKVDVKDGKFVGNPKIDVLKLAVVERHKNTGNVGMGLVEGFGLTGATIGTTIAHDSHNMLLIGDNDQDMKVAMNHLKSLEGGLVIVKDGKVVDSLQLEVAGLMTNASLETVNAKLTHLENLAREYGVPNGVDPFMTLAFLALPVIPDLKVTDYGLFDVSKFEFVDIEE